MKKLARVVGLCALALAISGAANAAPVTYDLTLTPINGTTAGTGSFTIDGDDYLGTGNESFTPNDAGKTLLALSFDIGGLHFSLADGLGYGQAFFQNGNLISVVFNGSMNYGMQSLGAGAMTYNFNNYMVQGSFSQGSISASLHQDTGPGGQEDVPEPGLLALFGMGMLGIGFGARRRKRIAA